MKPNLPQEADARLIESMCLRYDHAHGIKVGSLQNRGGVETDEEFANRQESNRRLMRKLYEEVSGYGFFTYPEEE